MERPRVGLIRVFLLAARNCSANLYLAAEFISIKSVPFQFFKGSYLSQEVSSVD